LRPLLFALAVVSTSCQTLPDAPDPTFARGHTAGANPVVGAGRPIDQSRVNLVVEDMVNVAPPGAPANLQPAGVRGDGRNRFGATAPVANEYQGAFCGVVAFLFNGSASEDGALKIDTDDGYTSGMATSCGPARVFVFFLDGPGGAGTPIGALTYIPGVWTLSPGASVLRRMSFANQGVLSSCKLWFDSSLQNGSDVRITRLPDVNGARQWRLESQGSHTAVCTTTDKKGRVVPTGVSHYLPFGITITEVPPPIPTFP